MKPYPDGKLNEQDEGELEMRVGIEQECVCIEFAHPTKWIAMPAKEAKALAIAILKYVNTIELNKTNKNLIKHHE